MGGFPSREGELVYMDLLSFSPGLSIFPQEHPVFLTDDTQPASWKPAWRCYVHVHDVIQYLHHDTKELPDAGVGGEDIFLREFLDNPV